MNIQTLEVSRGKYRWDANVVSLETIVRDMRKLQRLGAKGPCLWNGEKFRSIAAVIKLLTVSREQM